MSEGLRWTLRIAVLIAVAAYIYYLVIYLSPDADVFAPR